MTAQGSVALSLNEKNLQQILQVLAQVQQGHLNCVVSGTLTPNATSTVISAPTCTANSAIIECPLTADAANDRPMLWYTPASGQFTVHHPSQAQNDRTFAFLVVG